MSLLVRLGIFLVICQTILAIDNSTSSFNVTLATSPSINSTTPPSFPIVTFSPISDSNNKSTLAPDLPEPTVSPSLISNVTFVTSTPTTSSPFNRTDSPSMTMNLTEATNTSSPTVFSINATFTPTTLSQTPNPSISNETSSGLNETLVPTASSLPIFPVTNATRTPVSNFTLAPTSQSNKTESPSQFPTNSTAPTSLPANHTNAPSTFFNSTNLTPTSSPLKSKNDTEVPSMSFNGTNTPSTSPTRSPFILSNSTTSPSHSPSITITPTEQNSTNSTNSPSISPTTSPFHFDQNSTNSTNFPSVSPTDSPVHFDQNLTNSSSSPSLYPTESPSITIIDQNNLTNLTNSPSSHPTSSPSILIIPSDENSTSSPTRNNNECGILLENELQLTASSMIDSDLNLNIEGSKCEYLLAKNYAVFKYPVPVSGTYEIVSFSSECQDTVIVIFLNTMDQCFQDISMNDEVKCNHDYDGFFGGANVDLLKDTFAIIYVGGASDICDFNEVFVRITMLEELGTNSPTSSGINVTLSPTLNPPSPSTSPTPKDKGDPIPESNTPSTGPTLSPTRRFIRVPTSTPSKNLSRKHNSSVKVMMAILLLIMFIF